MTAINNFLLCIFLTLFIACAVWKIGNRPTTSWFDYSGTIALVVGVVLDLVIWLVYFAVK